MMATENRIGEMIIDSAIQREGYAKRWVVEQIDTSFLPPRRRIQGMFKTEQRANNYVKELERLEYNNIKFEVYSMLFDEYEVYDDYKQKLPRLNSKNWKKVDTNLYEYIGDDFPKYYKWTVVNDGIVYSGIERSLAQANNLIKRAKKGLLKSKR